MTFRGDPMPGKIWMFERTFEPRYDAAMVCALTSVSHDSLQNWVKRGLLEPEGGGGKGFRRLYTKYDVIEIAIASNLTRVGVETGLAFWFAGEVLGSTYNHLKTYREKGGLLDFDGALACATCFIIAPEMGRPRSETEFKVVDWASLTDEELRENILAPQDAVIQVAGGGIITDLELREHDLYGDDLPSLKLKGPAKKGSRAKIKQRAST